MPARGLEVELEWTVVGDGIEDRVRERARDLVRLAGPLRRRGEAARARRLDRGRARASSSRTTGCRAAPRSRSTTSCITRPTARNYIAIYLSPNLDPGRAPRHRGRRLEGPAHRRGSSRRPLQRLDRARRSRRARAGGGRRLFRFPSFFTEAIATSTRTRSARWPAGIGSSPCRTSTTRASGSTSRAARARRATAGSSRRSPRRAPTSSRPTASPHPDEPWIVDDRHEHGQPLRRRRRRADARRQPGAYRRRSAPASCSAPRSRCRGPRTTGATTSGFGRINPAAAIEEANAPTSANEVRPTRPPMKLHIFQSAHGRLPAARRQGQETACSATAACAASMRSHVRASSPSCATAGRELDYVYVSHIDSDHISGVLQLLEDEVEWRVLRLPGEDQASRRLRRPTVPRPPVIKGCCTTPFSDQIGINQSDGRSDLLAAAVPSLFATADPALVDVGAGAAGSSRSRFRRRSKSRGCSASDALDIPRQPAARDRADPASCCSSETSRSRSTSGSMKFTIVGPTAQELTDLKNGWVTWLQTMNEDDREGDPRASCKRRIDEFSNGVERARRSTCATGTASPTSRA